MHSMSEISGRVLTVQVGMPARRDADTDPWFTGIFKSRVEGPVALNKRNLAGDAQADLRVHGGPNKAVMAYSAENYPLWRAELRFTQEQLPFGAFGENLTITGLNEQTVCIGDVHQIGTATLQVSQPRSPCWKLARKWTMPDLPKRVVLTKRSGWYYRVLEEGALQAGDKVRLIERIHPDWPIRRITDVTYNIARSPGDLLEMERLEELASQWKEL
jgi:MOSC domain-containing protein YiiM